MTEHEYEALKNRIERQFQAFDERIVRLEEMSGGQHEQLPVIHPIPEEYRKKRPRRDDEPVAICGECGRTVNRVECYSCPNEWCPIQPKIMA